MKLCDRCRVSGCCLTYLGNACKSARKRVCPDVMLNNAERIQEMSLDELADFLATWLWKSRAWMQDFGEVQAWLMENYKEGSGNGV